MTSQNYVEEYIIELFCMFVALCRLAGQNSASKTIKPFIRHLEL